MSLAAPGRRWVIVGILVLLGVLAILLIGVFWSISRFDLRQVVMPGKYDFDMPKPGTIQVAYEPVSEIDGDHIASPQWPTMELVFKSSDGEVVRLPLGGEMQVGATYSMDSREGFFIDSVELSQGTWQLMGQPSPATTGREVFAIGRSSVQSIVTPIIVTGIVAAILGPIGVGILVIGTLKWVKSRGDIEEKPQIDFHQE